jgi:hypothetical protein
VNATLLIVGRFAISAMVAFVLAGHAAAQDEPAPEIPPLLPTPPSTIEINFVPGAWLTRVNGDEQLGPSPAATEIRIEEAFDLDSYEAVFNGELSITKNNFYELKFSGFDFEADSTGTFAESAVFGSLNLDPGDVFNTTFEMTSIAAEFCAWTWQPYCVGPTEGGGECRVALKAGPVFGVRLLDIDHTVEVEGEGTAIGQGEWLAPYAGFQFEIRFDVHDTVPLVDWLNFEAGGVIGPAIGGDHGLMTQMHAGFTAFFTPNIGVGVGYRLIQVDVGYDDFEFAGGLQGVFLYGMLRF